MPEEDKPTDRRKRELYSGPERRAPEQATPFSGLPQWARVIAMVGIPGAIALFLVWVGSQSLPKMETEMIASRIEMQRTREIIQQQVTQEEQIYRLLQRICAEIAKTDESRARCFER